MASYPCGICNISVKYSALLCTGPCHKWHHAKCLGLPQSDLKKLMKAGKETWRCEKCRQNDSAHSEEATVLVKTPVIDEKQLREKILNLSENGEDLETSLTIAAEAGNLLLHENNVLKQEMADLKLKYNVLKLEYEDKLKVADDQLENNLQNNEHLEKEHKLEIIHLQNKLKANNAMMEDIETQINDERCSYERKIKDLEEVILKNGPNQDKN